MQMNVTVFVLELGSLLQSNWHKRVLRTTKCFEHTFKWGETEEFKVVKDAFRVHVVKKNAINKDS